MALGGRSGGRSGGSLGGAGGESPGRQSGRGRAARDHPRRAGAPLRAERTGRLDRGGLEAAIDGVPAREGTCQELPAGTTLEFGRARTGARAWLAIGGGIDVPELLGSRSTDAAAGLGGLAGRPLVAGDRLTVVSTEISAPGRLARDLNTWLATPRLRILPGPDGESTWKRLCQEERTVDSRSDRRGVRLLPVAAGARPDAAGELRSQGTLPGAVQAPASGETIVLGPDAPVTGGYAWVAQVVAADLGRLAHLLPGARIRFEPATLEAAEAAWTLRERELERAVIS